MITAMKKIFFYISILLAVASGCKKGEYLMYSDGARVQLNDTATINSTFYYDAPAVVKDTIYIRVNTIGGITAADRPVKLQQIPEYDYSYVRDPVTNQITDTIATEKPFKAVPGIHYVALDDKSLESRMVIRANRAFDSIPVILLRDATLKDNSYRLRLKVMANTEFTTGEKNATEVTIVFSDKLERFFSWRVDTYTAEAFSWLGKYSTAKHQFMIDVLKENIDEAWYQASKLSGSLRDDVNNLKQALLDFNNNPANIASGKAPLRETSAPSSPLVTFP